ncbi:radical SAM family heme chaperone HemW [Candidatus Laterigemmans baculatus]|uniref:radical SAM family heme chaperone HemW n=1 Tax=Candidatus Laterigemmans baculatus TaxID=2770505 RepID=UPI001F378690|nr:radical SAM family heme chaperone HemW [Candidatus Laterigemmans baculatus]
MSDRPWPTPQSAYVHVPFCRHRCGYCNFSVLTGRDQAYAESYLDALERELRRLGEPRELDTLFIGGGTPTHLSPAWIESLLQLVGRWLRLRPGGEFSVEANPSDIDAARLEVLAAAGVNRISLGVQSFRAEKLRVLERDHSPRIATAAIEAAAAAIGNVSIDLIFAAPGETVAEFAADLRTATSLPIDHLSTYGLTFEKGTAFWSRLLSGQLDRLEEDTELAMYRMAIDVARAAGFEHYEVSNFAKPGRRCRHNLAYWEGRGWYAFGPGAARFVGGRREVNHRSPTTYIRRLLAGEWAIAECDAIDRETWARERIAFGLRMIDGVDLERIAAETGVPVGEQFAKTIDRFCRDGFLTCEGNRLRLTDRGLVLSDAIVAEFL